MFSVLYRKYTLFFFLKVSPQTLFLLANLFITLLDLAEVYLIIYKFYLLLLLYAVPISYIFKFIAKHLPQTLHLRRIEFALLYCVRRYYT